MQEHKTTDIYLVSALVASGAKLVEVKKAGYNQAEFIVRGELADMIMQFQNRNLKVDAMTLFENHKSLKSRANDVLRNTYNTY